MPPIEVLMKVKHFLLSAPVMLLCLLSISCDGVDSAVRYEHIAIPGYGMSDYLPLLDSKDPDQVYNAICNLADTADTVGATLKDGAPASGTEDYDRKLKDYETTRSIYAGIQKTLQAPSLKVRLASVHFIKLMGKGYGRKDELVKLLLSVKSGNDFLDFELVSALTYLCSQDAIVGEKYIRAFLASPSWLVSRAAYGLVNANGNTALRRELIGKYKAEKDETEKLLLVSSLRSSYENEFAAFIVDELSKAGDEKTRETLSGILVNPAEIAPCIAVIDERYANLSAPVTARLAASIYASIGSDFSRALLKLLIGKNYDFLGDREGDLAEGGEVNLFSALHTAIDELEKKTGMNESEQKIIENLVAMEKSLMENPALAAGWKEYQAAHSEPWTVEYEELAKDFVDKAGKLLEKNQVEEREKIISEMEANLKLPEQAPP
jgi:hypothetical protein